MPEEEQNAAFYHGLNSNHGVTARADVASNFANKKMTCPSPENTLS